MFNMLVAKDVKMNGWKLQERHDENDLSWGKCSLNWWYNQGALLVWILVISIRKPMALVLRRFGFYRGEDVKKKGTNGIN